MRGWVRRADAPRVLPLLGRSVLASGAMRKRGAHKASVGAQFQSQLAALMKTVQGLHDTIGQMQRREAAKELQLAEQAKSREIQQRMDHLGTELASKREHTLERAFARCAEQPGGPCFSDFILRVPVEYLIGGTLKEFHRTWNRVHNPG